MKTLTWREVAAPNFAGVSAMQEAAARSLNQAVSYIGNAIDSYQKSADGLASNQVMKNLQGMDAQQIKAALSSGAAFQGIDPSRINENLFKLVDDRLNKTLSQENSFLDQERARLGMDQTRQNMAHADAQEARSQTAHQHANEAFGWKREDRAYETMLEDQVRLLASQGNRRAIAALQDMQLNNNKVAGSNLHLDSAELDLARQRDAAIEAQIEGQAKNQAASLGTDPRAWIDFLEKNPDQAGSVYRFAPDAVKATVYAATGMNPVYTPVHTHQAAVAGRSTTGSGHPSYASGTGNVVGLGSDLAGGYTPPITAFSSVTDLLGRAEANGLYNAYNSGTKHNNGKVGYSGRTDEPITIGRMIQDEATKSGKDKSRVFAYGKYQFTPGFLKDAMKIVPGLSKDSVLDPQTQEKIMEHMMPKAVKDYVSGRSNDVDAAVNSLADKWAAIPLTTTGKSKYHGSANKARTTVDQARQALMEARNAYGVGERLKAEATQEARAALGNLPQQIANQVQKYQESQPGEVIFDKPTTSQELGAQILSMEGRLSSGVSASMADIQVGASSQAHIDGDQIYQLRNAPVKDQDEMVKRFADSRGIEQKDAQQFIRDFRAYLSEVSNDNLSFTDGQIAYAASKFPKTGMFGNQRHEFQQVMEALSNTQRTPAERREIESLVQSSEAARQSLLAEIEKAKQNGYLDKINPDSPLGQLFHEKMVQIQQNDARMRDLYSKQKGSVSNKETVKPKSKKVPPLKDEIFREGNLYPW